MRNKLKRKMPIDEESQTSESEAETVDSDVEVNLRFVLHALQMKLTILCVCFYFKIYYSCKKLLRKEN